MRVSVEPAPGSNIGFVTDDRFYPGRGSFLVELDGAEHVAVVGHSQGGHSHLSRTGYEVLRKGGSVEEAVVSVNVKVGESFRFHGVPLGGLARIEMDSTISGCRLPPLRRTAPVEGV